MPFTPELLNLGFGLVTGFIFKYWAQQAQDRAQIVELLIKKQQSADESADKAAARVPIDAGKIVRRIIVISVVFGVILAPFILALLNKPVIVQEITPEKSWLFGLLKTGGNLRFYELWGYLLMPEVRQVLLAICGFYFGGAAAKRN